MFERCEHQSSSGEKSGDRAMPVEPVEKKSLKGRGATKAVKDDKEDEEETTVMKKPATQSKSKKKK